MSSNHVMEPGRPSTAAPSSTIPAPTMPNGSVLARFIRRHPLGSFFLWFFTVGQAFAFFPVVAGDSVPGIPPQMFILGSTLVGLLLPTAVITYVTGGSPALRSMWQRVIAVRVGGGWYALALLGIPLLAIAIAVGLLGPPADASWPTLAGLFLPHFVLPFLLTFLPNNLWEEVAWTGFVQARLQARHGAVLAAVIAGVLFALQHISLAVNGNSVVGVVVVMVALAALAIPFRFVTGWLYNRTASLFLVGVIHAAGNAVGAGSGFHAGVLATLYPEQQIAYVAHLLAFAVVGLVVVITTRGRLGTSRT